MRTFTTFVTLTLLALISTLVQAQDAQPDFATLLRAAIMKKDSGIVALQQQYRDLTCPMQATLAARNTCVLAYNAVIMRRQAERAELELMLAAIDLPASQGSVIHNKVVPIAEFNAMNARTGEMADQIYAIFPSKQTGTKKP